MHDLRRLTAEYVSAFDAKDLTAVGDLLTEDFVLCDPVVVRVEGKQAALDIMAGMFADNDRLDFTARNIFVDGQTSIIEFELHLGETRLEGTDVIEWRNGKMAELRAYLDIPK